MAVDYKELKKGGFMRQRQKDHFSMRLKSVGGHFTAAQLGTVQKVAEQYGKGYVHLTSRQGIEIPFIRLEDIDEVKKTLHEGGVSVGVCGPRVRTITACQGCAVCASGLIDTQHLANEFDKRYGGRELPHKFKFGFTGCHNNCLKAEENDFGVKGGVKPQWSADNCTFCGVCEAVCPEKAITVKADEGKVVLDAEKCVYCGKCIKSCPTDAWQGRLCHLVRRPLRQPHRDRPPFPADCLRGGEALRSRRHDAGLLREIREAERALCQLPRPRRLG